MSKEHINPWSWHGLPWSDLRPRDKANDFRASQWTFTWVGCLIAAGLIAKLGDAPRPVEIALVLLTLFPAWKMVGAFRRMLREADEMLRRVQFEGMAVGFGAGIICGMTVFFLTPPGPWWFIGAFVPMTVGYAARVVIAARAIAKDEQ